MYVNGAVTQVSLHVWTRRKMCNPKQFISFYFCLSYCTTIKTYHITWFFFVVLNKWKIFMNLLSSANIVVVMCKRLKMWSTCETRLKSHKIIQIFFFCLLSFFTVIFGWIVFKGFLYPICKKNCTRLNTLIHNTTVHWVVIHII